MNISSNKIAEAKLHMQEEAYNMELSDMNYKLNKKSDIEILEADATEAKQLSDEHIATINRAKEIIAETTPKYEAELLRVVCNKEQIARKISGLEYNTEFCRDNEVLDQFRVKK